MHESLLYAKIVAEVVQDDGDPQTVLLRQNSVDQLQVTMMMMMMMFSKSVISAWLQEDSK